MAAAETQAERKLRDEQARAVIEQKLEESGEKEKLILLLQQRLVECGWKDEVKAYCKEVIKNKGLEKITVDELTEELTPRARAKVPESVKAEMLLNIKKFLQTA